MPEEEKKRTPLQNMELFTVDKNTQELRNLRKCVVVLIQHMSQINQNQKEFEFLRREVEKLKDEIEKSNRLQRDLIDSQTRLNNNLIELIRKK